MARLSLDLLAQARVLARREPRRPKQASLRRSISASYYAPFHFLGEEATKLTVGTAHNRTELPIDAWNRVRGANEELALLFSLSLMLWPGLGGR
jgi:hypothetical protein